MTQSNVDNLKPETQNTTPRTNNCHSLTQFAHSPAVHGKVQTAGTVENVQVKFEQVELITLSWGLEGVGNCDRTRFLILARLPSSDLRHSAPSPRRSGSSQAIGQGRPMYVRGAVEFLRPRQARVARLANV